MKVSYFDAFSGISGDMAAPGVSTAKLNIHPVEMSRTAAREILKLPDTAIFIQEKERKR